VILSTTTKKTIILNDVYKKVIKNQENIRKVLNVNSREVIFHHTLKLSLIFNDILID
jgi:hypothetical protein